MRILDRYLLREFGLPLLYCLDAFALLWIVLDLFGTLDDFLEHHVRAAQVFRYYLFVLPEALVQIVPMALLLGLLFCLANLGKHNEILAMRAGGVSLARIATPLLGIGLVASVVVLVVNVFWVPGARAHSNSFMRELRGKGSANAIENLFFTSSPANRDWYVRRYDAASGIFENPEIHETQPDGAPTRDIYAQQAQWVNGEWAFFQADIYDHSAGSQPLLIHAAVTNFPAITEKPRQLLAENKLPDEMTSGELRRAIRTQRRTGRVARLAALETTLQYRYAFPMTCLLVIWIGLPLGLHVRKSGALKSVGTALVLVIAFHFGSNIVLALGTGGHIPPLLAAWAGNIVFAVVGLVLLWRVR